MCNADEVFGTHRRYPLIWAKAITPEGTFDFQRGAAFKGYGWADAPPDAPYVVRTACVAVQRTSSRGHKRRLNAAAISKAFIKKHDGIIAENHVILLLPKSPDAASPESLAEVLNNAAASAALDRVCGSASISVRLLERIELGMRPLACMGSAPDRLRISLNRSARQTAAASFGLGCVPCAQGNS
jgi:adenine-specific DNA-methyltransferase